MSTHDAPQTPAPAGWYDDGSGSKRWWDGQLWGDYAPPAPVIINVAPERLPVNGAAVGGFILGILALLTCWLTGVGLLFAVLGILFSGVGLYLVKQRGTGRGIASTGMVLSVVSLFIVFLMILLAVQS